MVLGLPPRGAAARYRRWGPPDRSGSCALFDLDGLVDRLSLLRFDNVDEAAAWNGSDDLRALRIAHAPHVEAQSTVIPNASFDESRRGDAI